MRLSTVSRVPTIASSSQNARYATACTSEHVSAPSEAVDYGSDTHRLLTISDAQVTVYSIKIMQLEDLTMQTLVPWSSMTRVCSGTSLPSKGCLAPASTAMLPQRNKHKQTRFVICTRIMSNSLTQNEHTAIDARYPPQPRRSASIMQRALSPRHAHQGGPRANPTPYWDEQVAAVQLPMTYETHRVCLQGLTSPGHSEQLLQCR